MNNRNSDILKMKFSKELYSKTALLKAAYNFTDTSYLHLDSDKFYYYVSIMPKNGHQLISMHEFENEMLAQSVRHEIYLQTKNIRELLLARAMSTSLITKKEVVTEQLEPAKKYSEDQILKDWFSDDHETK